MKKNFTLVLMTLLMSINVVATTYTVAGVSAILNGTDWDEKNGANDMKQDANGA